MRLTIFNKSDLDVSHGSDWILSWFFAPFSAVGLWHNSILCLQTHTHTIKSETSLSCAKLSLKLTGCPLKNIVQVVKNVAQQIYASIEKQNHPSGTIPIIHRLQSCCNCVDFLNYLLLVSWFFIQKWGQERKAAFLISVSVTLEVHHQFYCLSCINVFTTATRWAAVVIMSKSLFACLLCHIFMYRCT